MVKLFAFLQFRRGLTLSPSSYSLMVVLHYTSLVGFAGHLLFVLLFAWMGVWQMAVVNGVNCAVFLLCYGLNWNGRSHQALLLGSADVVLHALLAVAFIGWDSGFQYYLLALVPLIFYSQDWRPATRFGLSGAACGLYILLNFYSRSLAPWIAQAPGRLHVLWMINVIALFIVFSTLAYYYRFAATSAEKALKKANLKLEYLAQTDPLTGLANRRNIQEYIEAEIAHHRRSGRPFCIILGDLDNFKAINDRAGHDAGDIILVKVAELMQMYMRNQDHVARWGGEEFLMLLPGTSLEGARLVAERLREKIAAARISSAGRELGVSITFGIAEYDGCSTPDDCIQKADHAMYAGKRSGKNCVMLAQGQP